MKLMGSHNVLEQSMKPILQKKKKKNSNPTNYINRKGTYSFNVQAAVDYKFCFFDGVIK